MLNIIKRTLEILTVLNSPGICITDLTMIWSCKGTKSEIKMINLSYQLE